MTVRLILDWLSYTINVAVFGAWVWAKIRRLGRQRTVSRFLQSQRVTIHLPLRQHQENRMVVANEDFLAVLELANFLRTYGIESSFKEIPPAVANVEFGVGSVVICGPKSSEAVKQLYRSDPHYVLEEREGVWQIHERGTGNYLLSPMDHTSPQEKDIAYIGRRTNARGERFLLIGGIHAPGSFGAIRYIANHANIRKLLVEAGEAPFSAVISTTFNPDKLDITHAEILLTVRQHR